MIWYLKYEDFFWEIICILVVNCVIYRESNKTFMFKWYIFAKVFLYLFNALCHIASSSPSHSTMHNTSRIIIEKPNKWQGFVSLATLLFHSFWYLESRRQLYDTLINYVRETFVRIPGIHFSNLTARLVLYYQSRSRVVKANDYMRNSLYKNCCKQHGMK